MVRVAHEGIVAALRAFRVMPNGDTDRFVGPCPFCRTPGFVWNAAGGVWFCASVEGAGCDGLASGDTASLLEALRRRVGVRMSNVEAEQVDWLWSGRIARGKIAVIDGDPGLGKSLLTLELAAHVTCGKPMPDTALPCGEPGNAIVMNAEDGLADTIRPRLEAAVADLDRVTALGHDKPLRIPDDVSALRAAIVLHDAVLVIVDPFMAFLSGKLNANRDQDVRGALAPLARVAEETGAAIVLVRHLNKGAAANALYRGGGSIGIIGAARTGLLVAKDPADDARRILAPTKSNIGQLPKSLAFRITEASAGVPRLKWDGESHHQAAGLLNEPTGEERTSRDEAVGVLRAILADGPVSAPEATKQARLAGISDRTLDRARQQLGVRARKLGFSRGWVWSLPPSSTEDQFNGLASFDTHTPQPLNNIEERQKNAFDEERHYEGRQDTEGRQGKEKINSSGGLGGLGDDGENL